MYVTAVPNRRSPPAILLRESYREDGKVKNRTLANLSDWPSPKVEALRLLLRGEALVPVGQGGLHIAASLPHGHVTAVLGTLRKLGLERVLHTRPSRMRDLVVAMIVQRVLSPASKLATARKLNAETATTSLGKLLGVEDVTEDELYEALGWLADRQPNIEASLAREHLQGGCLVLYDLTSVRSYARTCPLARIGHSRDGIRNSLQIEFGVLCNKDGVPVAVEVFAGNTGDPATLSVQIEKLRTRFGLQRVVLVGDRGMITQARLDQEIKPVVGLGWISSLRAPAVQALRRDGALQLSLFDQRDLAEISSPEFPGERLVACRNPLLAEERRRKRDELLAATEKALERIVAATARERNPLRGEEAIRRRVDAVIGRWKMAKHLRVLVTPTGLTVERDEVSIRTEAELDGIYVVRTSEPSTSFASEDVVARYKDLARVERLFRSCKTVDLEVRPIFHRDERMVRGHVLLCVLAYSVLLEMRRKLAPLLFDDEDREGATTRRRSVVAKARVSVSAEKKAASKVTADGELPVQSFQGLLEHLGTLCRNEVRVPGLGTTMTMMTSPTPLQAKALSLLGVDAMTMDVRVPVKLAPPPYSGPGKAGARRRRAQAKEGL